MGQRPPSWPRLAASCMEDVTNPWDPSKCLSSPWSVKKRHWHFWQFKGGLLWIIFGWIFTLWIHCIWWRNCSRSFNSITEWELQFENISRLKNVKIIKYNFIYLNRPITNFTNYSSFLSGCCRLSSFRCQGVVTYAGRRVGGGRSYRTNGKWRLVCQGWGSGTG